MLPAGDHSGLSIIQLLHNII